MTRSSLASASPDPADVRTADAAVRHVRNYLAHHRGAHDIRVLVEEDPAHEALVVPRSAVELLARILAHMAAGQGVSVVPADAELTTQQAADLMNVSRPFLIGLLDAGEIDYRKVGKHRRVRLESLLDYQRTDDQRRRVAADELTELSQEMGLQ